MSNCNCNYADCVYCNRLEPRMENQDFISVAKNQISAAEKWAHSIGFFWSLDDDTAAEVLAEKYIDANCDENPAEARRIRALQNVIIASIEYLKIEITANLKES